MADLKELVEISRRYGADPEFVLAGGGNTSIKDEKMLYVKASGTSLASIDASGFVRMDRKKLDAIWDARYPEETTAREAAALTDLMASRAPGEESKRPSVETLMHGFFPSRLVVHTHPALVNGLTCGKNGKAEAGRLFGDIACWVPLVDPGYILARTVKDSVDAFRAEHGRYPEAVLLQNHGLVVAADTPAEVDRITGEVVGRIASKLVRGPDMRSRAVDAVTAGAYAAALAPLAGGPVLVESNAEIMRLVADRGAHAPVSSSFSPDHIVYYGHKPLFVESPAEVKAGWDGFIAENGVPPRIVLAKGLGFFACGPTAVRTAQARDLFLDAVKVSVFAESFGGPLFMPERMISFIRNWEVEKYRSSVSGGT